MRQRRWVKYFMNFGFDLKYHLEKANVVAGVSSCSGVLLLGSL